MLMSKGEIIMRYLKIEDKKGLFYSTSQKQYISIDKISKEDILDLLNSATNKDEDFEIDEYIESSLPNPAHAIIYSSLYSKFSEIISNRERFIEESNNTYKKEFEKYKL